MAKATPFDDARAKNVTDKYKNALIAPIESIDIAEYHPLPDGEGPPTEVHMLFTLKDLEDTPILFRFKGPDTLDRVIAALVRHRMNVWPETDYPLEK